MLDIISASSKLKAMFLLLSRYKYHIECIYWVHPDSMFGTKDMICQREVRFISCFFLLIIVLLKW